MGTGTSGKNPPIASVVITYKNGGVSDFRKAPNGQVYSQPRLGGGFPEIFESKMSLKDIAKRAIDAGHKVETFTQKETEERDRIAQEEYDRRPDFATGTGFQDNRWFRKNARMKRLIARPFKR